MKLSVHTKAIAAFVAAAAAFVPVLASAQDYRPYDRGYGYDDRPIAQDCRQRVNDSTASGGLTGAAIGAAVGRSAAARGVRTEGAILGAVLGAVVGSQVGRSRQACDDPQYNPYNGRRDGQYDRYPNAYPAPRADRGADRDDRDYRGRRVDYRGSGRNDDCGWGQTTVRAPNGQLIQRDVYMCRASDGQYYPAGQ